MSIDRRLALLVLLATVGSSPLTAQVNGSEDVQVNTGTAGAQSRPSVATAADGHFLVVWESEASVGSDTDGWSIQGRWFDANGEPLADEFQVNTATTGNQWAPSVAATAAGEFVVAWHSYEGDYYGNSSAVRLQRYQPDGSPLGSELDVASTSGNSAFSAGFSSVGVAPGADGGFLVVWTHGWGVNCTGEHSACITERAFSAGGTPYTTSTAECLSSGLYGLPSLLVWSPAAAGTSAGEFVVAWSHYNYDTGWIELRGRRFNSTGVPFGEPFEMGDPPDGAGQPTSLVAGPEDLVSVAWTFSSGSAANVRTRRIKPDGELVGAVLQVNSFEIGAQYSAAIDIDPETPDAGFVVVWESEGSFGPDGSGTSIQARWIGWDGTPLDEQFQVNSFTPLGQSQPALSKGVAVWTSEQSPGSDSSGSSIQGRFLPRPATLGLLGWWQGEVDATDSSAFGNHGTLEGGTGFVSGVSGRAFVFDGVDDALIVPDADSLDLGEGDFSLTFWVRTAGQYPILLDKRSANPCNGFMVYLQAGHPGIRICEPSGASQFTSSTFVADEDVHHVAVTVERASPTGGRIWVDGELVHTFDPTPRQGWLANEVPLTIGRQGDDYGGLGHLHGILDDVRLYGRALSEADVHSLAAARGDSIFWDDLELGTTLSWSLAMP